MGVDLTVCPSQGRLRSYPDGRWFLAYNRLRLDRDYHLFAQLSDHFSRVPDVARVVDPRPIPPTWTFSWYGDDGCEDESTDAYGNPLTFVTAREFQKLLLGDDTTHWNRCVVAFLSSLDPDTEVVLYWH